MDSKKETTSLKVKFETWLSNGNGFFVLVQNKTLSVLNSKGVFTILKRVYRVKKSSYLHSVRNFSPI